MTAPFKMGSTKMAVATTIHKATPHIIPLKKDTMGLIQGRKPMSHNEWYVALALWKFKIPFLYQVWIAGGYYIRGGQVVDFVVYNPFSTPVQVFGQYWHDQQISSTDELKLAALRSYFSRDAITLLGEETSTKELAEETVRRKVLHG